MSVFGDVFGGDSAAGAADRNRDLFMHLSRDSAERLRNSEEASQGFLTRGFAGGRDALSGGFGSAQNVLRDATGGAGDITRAGYDQARADVAQFYQPALGNLATQADVARNDVWSGTDRALGALGAGTAGASGRFDQAAAAYTPLSDLGSKYGGATTMALNALGVNGAEGAATARGAFEAGPSYQWEVDQGIDAINRRRNAAGMLASGNADRDAIDYVQNRARTAFGDWRDRLIGFTNSELAATSGAASGVAGARTGQASLDANAGQSRAQMEANRGTMLSELARAYGTSDTAARAGMANALTSIDIGRGTASGDIYSRYGLGSADLASRQGAGLAGLDVGQGTSLANLNQLVMGRQLDIDKLAAQGMAKANTDEGAARQAGSANLFNFGKEIVSTGAKLLGGFG